MVFWCHFIDSLSSINLPCIHRHTERHQASPPTQEVRPHSLFQGFSLVHCLGCENFKGINPVIESYLEMQWAAAAVTQSFITSGNVKWQVDLKICDP